MAKSHKPDKLPQEKELVGEEETLTRALPFSDYARDTAKLSAKIQLLEKDYDEREKVINRIMEYGTGIESEKALRMYPISVLKKWEESLERYRASSLKTETKGHKGLASRLKRFEKKHWENEAKTLKDEKAMFQERAKKVQEKAAR